MAEDVVPKKDYGEDLEQDTVHAPPSYGQLIPENEGRWFVLEDQAVVWTDDMEGAGIAWAAQTDENQRLWKHFSSAKSAGFSAGVAYQLALMSVEGAEEDTGKLSGASEAFDSMTDQENTRA